MKIQLTAACLAVAALSGCYMSAAPDPAAGLGPRAKVYAPVLDEVIGALHLDRDGLWVFSSSDKNRAASFAPGQLVAFEDLDESGPQTQCRLLDGTADANSPVALHLHVDDALLSLRRDKWSSARRLFLLLARIIFWLRRPAPRSARRERPQFRRRASHRTRREKCRSQHRC